MYDDLKKTTMSKDLLEKIFNCVSESLILTDISFNIKKVNQATLDILGYSEHDLIDKPISMIVEENTLSIDPISSQELNKHGPVLKDHEVMYKSKNGGKIPIKLSASVIKDCIHKKHLEDCPKYVKNQKSCSFCEAINVIIVGGDMRAINSLIEHEKGRLTSILRDMIDGVIMVDRKGIIEMVNPAGEKLLRFLSISRQGDLLVHLGDYYMKKPMGLILNNEKEFISYDLSFTNESEQMTVSMIIAPIKGKTQNIGVVIVLRNITKEYNLRQQLLHTEKLSTVGEMVSGIAHEINNPLAGIMGLTQLLQLHSELPDAVRKNIDKIFSYSDRTKRIIQNLLTFARAHKPEKTPVNINQLIEQTIEMLEFNMKTNDINIVKDMDLGLPDIVADMYQIQQVFFNIINNACQALAKYDGDRVFTIKTGKNDNYIVTSFHNTGHGISKALIKKIFNPFFTTKGVGEGTGMGLSVSYGIIKEHEGNIYATSKDEEGGVTFFVELPIKCIASDDMVNLIIKDDKPEHMLQNMNILIVDDEKPVAESIASLLKTEGHICEIATRVDEAIKKLAINDYDLIISDIKMPGLNGKEFYLYLKLHKPNLVDRFVTITGDVMNPETKSFVDANDIPCITKPFTFAELKSVISKTSNKKEI